MKRSGLYTMAMLAVLQSQELCDDAKLEVLGALMEDRKDAIWREEREAKKEAEV